MKAPFSLSLVFLLFLSGVSVSFAQTIPPNPLVPKDAAKSSKRNLGGGGDIGGNVGVSTGSSRPRTVVVQYVAVTPLQGWTNTDGKTIQARILAFSAPKPGEPGPVEVIREGKVRFLIPGGKQPVEYPLEKLTKSDKEEIERIAEAAAKGTPGEKEEEKSGEKEQSTETKE